MSNSVESWRRRLSFELARASGWERAGIIRKALADAGPLAAHRGEVCTIAYDLAREYGITDEQIRAAKSMPAGSGFFRNLPSDDGPRAA